MAGAMMRVLILAVAAVALVAHSSGAPCTTACNSCKAVSDAAKCCGIRDDDCATCANGYKWWPCGSDKIGKCVCSGGTSSEAEQASSQEEGESGDPADAGASEAASQSPVERTSGGADASAGATNVLDNLASSVSTSVSTAAGTVSVPSFTLPPVASWRQCGGLTLAGCNLDAPCAPCADPAQECISWEPGNSWYWQCRPRADGGADMSASTPALPVVPANLAAFAVNVPFLAAEESLVASGTATAQASASVRVDAVATETLQATPVDASGVQLGLNNGCPSECDQGDLSSLLTSSQWENLFPHRNDPACKSNKLPDGTVGFDGDFYTYEAFLGAARLYPCFLGQGDKKQRTLELSAFLAQISHETTGGWDTAPDGPQAWGLCFKEEVGCETGGCVGYCAPGDPCQAAGEDINCPCTTGKTYHGRGPMQLSWNYNYGPTGIDLSAVPEYANLDLLNDPDQITKDARLAFATALDFWMKPRFPKPSAHSVMIGCWEPSAQDIAAGRLPGFGATTNIINGAVECGKAGDSRVEDRVAYFEKYNAELGVDGGANLRCDDQQRF